MDAATFSFAGRFARDADKPWLLPASGGPVRFADLAARAAAIRGAVAETGAPGEVVAVSSADPAAIVASVLACWAEGRIAAVFDPATPPERKARLRDLLGFDLELGGETPGTLGDAGDLARALDRLDRHSPALLLFSSGSTGTPKCIPLSAANLLANVGAVNARLGVGAGDVFLCTSPPFYAHGLYNSLLTSFFLGATALFPGVLNPMNAAAAFGLAAREGATVYHLTPTMVKIANLVGSRLPSPPRFRRALCGTARVEPADAARFEALFGLPLLRQYGMTESLIMTLTGGVSDPADSVGLPVGCELFLLDGDGRPVPPGEEGEIAVRSPSAFGTYFRQPEETAASYRDGLFFTGDLGRMDPAGSLFVTGRIKELIKKGGLNISPAEIERALLAVPGVREAAVVGYPDPAYGEQIAAFFVGDPALEPEGILAALGGALPRTHLPKRVIRLAELPKTVSGKVAKAALRERVTAG